MDSNEVYILLCIIEKAHAQGTSFLGIRNAAIARLEEIQNGLNPAAEAEEPVEETEDAAA